MTLRRQRGSRRAGLSIAAAAMILASSSFCFAQSAADREAARQLFNDAFAHEKAENWLVAIPKLRAALEIVETPGLHYHLAYCLEQQAEIVEALDHYDRAEELLRSGAKAPDVEELLGSRQAALQERVPTITVRVNEAEKVTKFLVDGTSSPLLLLGQPIRLNPGSHEVLVEAEGRPLPVKRRVTLVERQRETLDMIWPAAAPAAEPTTFEPAAKLDTHASSGFSPRTAVLIGEATLAVAGLGVGLGFTLHANALQNEADALRETLMSDSSCSSTQAVLPPECEELDDIVKDREPRARNIALAGFVGGGVFAAATLGTWLIWKPKSSANPAAALRIVPMGAQGLMWSAAGRF